MLKTLYAMILVNLLGVAAAAFAQQTPQAPAAPAQQAPAPTQAQKDAFVAVVKEAGAKNATAGMAALLIDDGVDDETRAWNLGAHTMLTNALARNPGDWEYHWGPPPQGGAKNMEVINKGILFKPNCEPAATLEIKNLKIQNLAIRVPVCLKDDKLGLVATIRQKLSE